jgi:Protein of unknown function (DUF5818)
MMCTDIARSTRGLPLISMLPQPLNGNSESAALGFATKADKSSLIITGLLTDEGVECQALRAESGELFTLIGDLKGFQTGLRVRVSGEVLPLSKCQQGTTLRVAEIAAS